MLWNAVFCIIPTKRPIGCNSYNGVFSYLCCLQALTSLNLETLIMGAANTADSDTMSKAGQGSDMPESALNSLPGVGRGAERQQNHYQPQLIILPD